MELDNYSSEEIRLIAKGLLSTFGSYSIRGQELLFDSGEEPTAQEIADSLLSATKAKAIEIIDGRAEGKRTKIGNLRPGQQSTYREKVIVAQKQIADETLTAAEAKWLDNEIGIFGADRDAVANVILTTRDGWIAAGQVIEKTRISAKRQIEMATTVEAVETIVENTDFN